MSNPPTITEIIYNIDPIEFFGSLAFLLFIFAIFFPIIVKEVHVPARNQCECKIRDASSVEEEEE